MILFIFWSEFSLKIRMISFFLLFSWNLNCLVSLSLRCISGEFPDYLLQICFCSFLIISCFSLIRLVRGSWLSILPIERKVIATPFAYSSLKGYILYILVMRHHWRFGKLYSWKNPYPLTIITGMKWAKLIIDEIILWSHLLPIMEPGML